MKYNGGLSAAPRSSSAVQVRPSMKLVRPWYTLAFVVLALVYFFNNNRPEPIGWLLILPVPIFIWAVVQHIRQRFTILTLSAGKLRYQTGMFSRSTRTLDLNKIQDVRVTQTILQRIFGLGTVALETAGETGGLRMKNVDRPQAVADYILEVAGK